MGSCFLKGSSDKTVLIGVRESLTQGFSAPNWLDLRVGWFMSLTDEVSDDLGTTVAGLAEAPASTPTYVLANHYYIGLKDRSALMPYDIGSVFAGFTSLAGTYSARLSTSDIASGGSTNLYYWRPNNPGFPNRTFLVSESKNVRATADNVPPFYFHFPQDTVNAGGYAVLLGMQLLRSNASSKVVTINVKSVAQSADILYSNTPTTQLIHDSLESFPTSVQAIGPFTMNALPTAFFFYWPFRQSRLRIHCQGFLRAA
jgi:hypothetical protein